tara:strand:- start:451 stop:750 length:300 start_codon:yes stop_codon:yes gene_type:complete
MKTVALRKAAKRKANGGPGDGKKKAESAVKKILGSSAKNRLEKTKRIRKEDTALGKLTGGGITGGPHKQWLTVIAREAKKKADKKKGLSGVSRIIKNKK